MFDIRIPEPEKMTSEEEDHYSRANYSEPHEQYASEIISRLSKKSALNIADLGCGPGDLLIRIRERGAWNLWGIDFSPNMLAFAQEDGNHRKTDNDSLPVNWVIADIKNTGFADKFFDVIICNSVLHHMQDPSLFWLEVKRLAGQNAWIFLRDLRRPASLHEAETIISQNIGNESQVVKDHYLSSLKSAFTITEVEEQLRAAGLHGLKVTEIEDRYLNVEGANLMVIKTEMGSKADNQLKPALNLPLSVALAVSTIIGSGLMGLPGLAIDTAGPEGALAAWLFTILLSVPLMLIFLALTRSGQSAGGLATYVGIAFGARARSAAAILIAVTFALCIPLGTLMGSHYISDIFKLPAGSPYVVSVIILAGCTAVNLVGIKPSGFVNSLSVIALITFIIVMASLNLQHLQTGTNAATDLVAGGLTDIPVIHLWTASAILFWAFLGWENLSFGSEEMKGGGRFISAVFWISFFIVTTLYLILALVSSGAAINGVPVNGVSGLLALFRGSLYELPVHILIVIVVIANVNAWVFAASRLYFGMARDGVFPKYLSHLSQNKMPSHSLITLFVIYCLITFLIAIGILQLRSGLMIANQNFIILYLSAIFCLFKISQGLWPKILAVLGLLCCSLFLTGFGIMLIIPISIGIAGYVFANVKTP